MICHLVTEDAFVELSILREKTAAVLNSIVDGAACAHLQALADIACDYLSAMDKTIQAMQESRVAVPA